MTLWPHCFALGRTVVLMLLAASPGAASAQSADTESPLLHPWLTIEPAREIQEENCALTDELLKEKSDPEPILRNIQSLAPDLAGAMDNYAAQYKQTLIQAAVPMGVGDSAQLRQCSDSLPVLTASDGLAAVQSMAALTRDMRTGIEEYFAQENRTEEQLREISLGTMRNMNCIVLLAVLLMHAPQT